MPTSSPEYDLEKLVLIEPEEEIMNFLTMGYNIRIYRDGTFLGENNPVDYDEGFGRLSR